tara:strand:- start:3550 stop:5310 length:1761 start_codon:yes stop_codon:yes gene_type:complete
MFYAIDKRTGEIILSLNVRDRKYKDTYNKELRFKCAGSCENGQQCNDDNVVFVNSKLKQAHFRHSSSSKCSANKAYIEFNNDFYSNWFNLFKYEYRKPYWYNCNLEQIKDDNNAIIVRYSQQNSNVIKFIEKYAQNKIIWILSLKNRKYSKIELYKDKIYVDFIGSKNDIPLYDDSKSIVYLDTGTDILLKVLLNSTSSCYGQEIECINIYDVCNMYEHLFTAYPYRKKDTFFRSLMVKQKEYIKQQELKYKKNLKYQEYLLSRYDRAHNEYVKTNTLESFDNIHNIYKRLFMHKLDNDLSLPKSFEHKKKYFDYAIKLSRNIGNIKNSLYKIQKKEKEIKELSKLSESKSINELQNISELISIYKTYFCIIKNLEQTYTDISYIETLLSDDGYILDLDLMIYNYENHIKLEKNIINNILYDEYVKELNILIDETCNWRVLSYLENHHKELKKKWYIEKQKILEESRKQELAIQNQKKKDKIKRQKERQQKKFLQEKKQLEYENELIRKRLEQYSEEYGLEDTQLTTKLLDIINNNYTEILKLPIKIIDDLNYIKKYYTYITHPPNHNLNKMILYIIKQEEYLQNI